MPGPIWRQLRDTYSLFWKIYERVTALLLLVFILAVLAAGWNVVATASGSGTLLEGKANWIGATLSVSVMLIMLGDIIKYALTGNPRDIPRRKWFSFRWAQKLKPSEVLMVPKGYEGDHADLVTVRCPRCGALHGFEPGMSQPRQCMVYGCKETVNVPPPKGDGVQDTKKKVEVAVPRGPSFGDVVDEVENHFGKWVLRHAWTVAEHIFKLTAWMIGATAVAAFAKRAGSTAVAGFAVILWVVWLAAAGATFFKVTIYLQDFAFYRWIQGKFRRPMAELLVALAMTVLVAVPSTYLFFAFIKVFTEIFTSGSLPK